MGVESRPVASETFSFCGKTLVYESVDFRQRLRYSAEVLMYQRFVGR
jgi:hypothetical protein